MHSLKALINASRNVFEVNLRSISSAKNRKYDSHSQGNKKKDQKYCDTKIINKDIVGEVVYGIHPVRMALLAKRRNFNSLYVTENVLESNKSEIVDILDMAEGLSIPLSIKKRAVLDGFSADRPHQGFCLDASKLSFQAINSDNIAKERRIVVLDSIQDPQNFGAILRSCYYFGYTTVLTSNNNSCGLTATVSKASSGAMELIDVYGVPDLAEFLSGNLTKDWLLIGTSVSNETTHLKLEDANKVTDGKIAVVFGNEERGVSEALGALCQNHVTVPAAYEPNLIGSLNVSVATGIILHALKITKDDGLQTKPRI